MKAEYDHVAKHPEIAFLTANRGFQIADVGPPSVEVRAVHAKFKPAPTKPIVPPIATDDDGYILRHIGRALQKIRSPRSIFE